AAPHPASGDRVVQPMRRIAVLLVATGLLVWLAAPALSSRPFVPRVVEFEQALGPSGWVRADGGWRSPVVRAPKRFDLVGLRWRAGEHATRIRVREAGGGWSRWTLMAADHAGGAGAEPVWAGGADAYQLQIDAPPRGLRARFVNATGSATARDRLTTPLRRAVHGALAAIAGPAARAQARGAPAIISRAAWGGAQCPPRAVPAYGQVQLGFVHHTVTANTYAPHESAAIVLSMCRYHRNDNGWNDIGYNFLVDRYGQIFEGRAGGIDQPVIGAQAQGYNGVSTGVANIGTFSQAPQTAAGVSATAELLAWKLSLHTVPVAGQVAVTSAGGSSNRYPSGQPVAFQRIAAHRDADKTSCPGDAFFAQLPQIRRQAAAIAPQYAFAPVASAVSLEAADRTLDYPQVAQLSGRATVGGGAALAGAPISVQVARGRGFVEAASTTTAADGTWTAPLQTRYSRSVRAVAQLPDGTLVSSPPLQLQVAPRLTLRAPKRVTTGRRFTVRGSISPRRSRLVLEIAREGADERMHTVARSAVRVRRGRFSTRVRLRRPALTRLRIRFRSDARNRGARSDVYLRAVRRR
ncbi:MAG TPA: N-acetylmuramoyl-L-alanine amidase, partial [Solirubrobacteraceae bacterium]|nr:N-acetylmuramoyl-L-alanine amidase [Solirubrobacteraceae bacterium]